MPQVWQDTFSLSRSPDTITILHTLMTQSKTYNGLILSANLFANSWCQHLFQWSIHIVLIAILPFSQSGICFGWSRLLVFWRWRFMFYDLGKFLDFIRTHSKLTPCLINVNNLQPPSRPFYSTHKSISSRNCFFFRGQRQFFQIIDKLSCEILKILTIHTQTQSMKRLLTKELPYTLLGYDAQISNHHLYNRLWLRCF